MSIKIICLVSLFSVVFISACDVEDSNDNSKSFNAKYTSVSLLDSNINDPVAVDAGPEISANGLEFYFHSSRAGGLGNMDLYVARRAVITDNWGPATAVATVNTASNEQSASLSGDGLTLFFASDRPGHFGRLDLYKSTRASLTETWSTPENLGGIVNSSANDSGPDIAFDGLVVFFFSDKSGGIGSDDLYAATRASVLSQWGLPVNLGSNVNSAYFDLSPEIASDGLSLYFHSTRPGGPGVYNIWRSSRDSRTAIWRAPQLMPGPVNSLASAFGPAVSNDWKVLYFASDDTSGNRDIWQAVP